MKKNRFKTSQIIYLSMYVGKIVEKNYYCYLMYCVLCIVYVIMCNYYHVQMKELNFKIILTLCSYSVIFGGYYMCSWIKSGVNKNHYFVIIGYFQNRHFFIFSYSLISNNVCKINLVNVYNNPDKTITCVVRFLPCIDSQEIKCKTVCYNLWVKLIPQVVRRKG